MAPCEVNRNPVLEIKRVHPRPTPEWGCPKDLRGVSRFWKLTLWVSLVVTLVASILVPVLIKCNCYLRRVAKGFCLCLDARAAAAANDNNDDDNTDDLHIREWQRDLNIRQGGHLCAFPTCQSRALLEFRGAYFCIRCAKEFHCCTAAHPCKLRRAEFEGDLSDEDEQ
jgi:hypothetical protein